MAEFLIKRTNGTNWLCDARPGDVVDMSTPQGKGFPIQTFDKDGERKHSAPVRSA